MVVSAMDRLLTMLVMLRARWATTFRFFRLTHQAKFLRHLADQMPPLTSRHKLLPAMPRCRGVPQLITAERRLSVIELINRAMAVPGQQ